jgi:uncharacterized spore protein YtfJ
MTTTIQDSMRDLLDRLRTQTVYGDPIERDGATFIPAVKVRGGGGGGNDTAGNVGGGFGMTATPVGMFVIRDGSATWQPAIDVNRIALGGQLVAIVALFVAWRLLRRR